MYHNYKVVYNIPTEDSNGHKAYQFLVTLSSEQPKITVELDLVDWLNKGLDK